MGEKLNLLLGKLNDGPELLRVNKLGPVVGLDVLLKSECEIIGMGLIKFKRESQNK